MTRPGFTTEGARAAGAIDPQVQDRLNQSPIERRAAMSGYLLFALLMAYVLILKAWYYATEWALADNVLLLLAFATFFVVARLVGAARLRHAIERLGPGQIFVLALVLRLLWIFATNVEQTNDFAVYDQMARDIARGDYLIQAEKPTGSSIVFACHYVCFGYVPLVPQVTQALLAALQVLMVYDIGTRTTGSPLAGKLAAAVLAVCPEHILHTNLLGSDVLFSFLVLSAVWFLRPAAAGLAWRALASGGCLGLAQWMRPTAPLLVAVSVAWLLLLGWSALPLRARAMAILGTIAGFLALTSPLAILNHHSYGVWSFSPSQMGGWSVMVGSNLESAGVYGEGDVARLDREVAERACPPGVHPAVFRDRVAREIGLQRMADQPVRFLVFAITFKMANLWGTVPSTEYATAPSRLSRFTGIVHRTALFYQLLMVLLVAAVILKYPKWFAVYDERLILVYGALVASGMHLFLESQARYHHMFLPLLALCVGCVILPRSDH
jgi:hypothetical protein